MEVLLSHSNPRKYTKNYDYHIPNIIAAIIYEKSFSLKNELSDLYCIDFELEDQDNLFSKKNIEIINKKYLFIYNMMKNSFHNIKWINHDRNSFSMWFKKINWVYKMRIRFFHKNAWDAGWIMESFYHLIIRNRVEYPSLPDMTEFNKRISSYF